ncbi:DotH/IcmK family type IV secretion protein [Vibrio owensii]|uniref:DotH/IcmK family type IV secretion protein n=1 Tax=Vibrio harveyi group TaxID=717610 RepID=UPI003CC63AFF
MFNNNKNKILMGMALTGLTLCGNVSATETQDVIVQSESGEQMVLQLTPRQMEILKAKKDILLKNIYEEQQLDQLRSMLDERQDKKDWELEKDKVAKYTPEQILELRNLDKEKKKAENAPLNGPVELKIRTIDIDTDAGQPITLNVARGYASSIIFYDQSGAPWPIEGDIIGDSSSFTKHAVGERKHTAIFEINKEFSESNALINLKGLNVPVVIRLVGSEKVVDSRLSVRIPKLGPDARQFSPTFTRQMDNMNADVVQILNGDSLPGSKNYEINGVKGTAVLKDGFLYIRTEANLISPPAKSSAVSPTGYKVYQVPPVNNLLFTVDGEMVTATIEESFEVNIKQAKSIFK